MWDPEYEASEFKKKNQPQKDPALFRIPPSPAPRHKHESLEETTLRKAKNLEAIYTVFENPEMHGDHVIVNFEGRKIEFHPATDTWYSPAKSKFGIGIQKICEQILKKKLEKENQVG